MLENLEIKRILGESEEILYISRNISDINYFENAEKALNSSISENFTLVFVEDGECYNISQIRADIKYAIFRLNF